MVEVAVAGGFGAAGPFRACTLHVASGAPLRIAPRGAGAGGGRFVLPGFVDAHVHLELSGIAGETLPRGFAAWIAALVERAGGLDAPRRAAAVAAGARALLASGCVAVGDIDASGEAWRALAQTPLEGISYRELLGAARAERLAALEAELAPAGDAAAAPARVRRGLSPHAPYSAGPELYAFAFDQARRRGCGVASHVGEADAEIELLDGGGGELAAFLRSRGASVPGWPRDRRGVLERIAALGPPPGLAVIHGNRLASHELALAAAIGASLVHCPRSHRYFGHPRPPLAAARAAGVNLALGTDSRASNDGLDLHRELATWRAQEPAFADAELFEAATAGGRRALALAPAGLRAGERATFQVVRARDGAPLRPERLVAAAVRGELETVETWIDGELAWSLERDGLAPDPAKQEAP